MAAAFTMAPLAELFAGRAGLAADEALFDAALATTDPRSFRKQRLPIHSGFFPGRLLSAEKTSKYTGRSTCPSRAHNQQKQPH
ncbi:MAG TPA: hypothetical protein VN541_14540, partial [Tepidisphaeraceae bacterium]|nr:hypothetical protein [Tepidisphaeraceae bacterium]